MKKTIKSNVIMLLFAVLCLASCEKEEPKPTASFSASTINAHVGDNISFTNNSMAADHCVWNFGDGQTSLDSNPSHAYSSKGVYSVVLTVYSPSGEKHDEMQMSITVTEAAPEEPKPTALFVASTTNASVGDNIFFTNKSMYADHYVWDFGDGQTSQESNPCHVYSSKGVYTVKLTAYSPSGGKIDEMQMSINVTEPEPPQEPTPTALFNASTTNACVDDNICFTNESMNAHHYKWDFGDGQTSTEPNPCHAYSSKGVYYVQLNAYSPTGEKCDVMGMSINVTEATGDVMFWMNSPGYIITVELDGIKKEISAYYPNYNPECGDEGCATFNDLTVGEHYYRAESYDGWWTGYITVKKGVCTRMLLLKEKAMPFKDGDMPEVDKRMAERIE